MYDTKNTFWKLERNNDLTVSEIQHLGEIAM